MKTESKFDLNTVITDQFIQALEAGTVPWHKPWGQGANLAPVGGGGRPYRGINRIITSMAGYDRPEWLTIKQINKRGGRILKDEHHTKVTLWQFSYCDSEGKWMKETEAMIRIRKGERLRKTGFLKYYRVWNIRQTDLAVDEYKPEVEAEDSVVEAECQAILDGWADRPKYRLERNHSRAFYSPATDHIEMPKRGSFDGASEYWHTLFHESVHATGHSARLDRGLDTKLAAFGSADYSEEELVAEIGAAFLGGMVGSMDAPTFDNAKAYLANWASKLKGDPKLVIKAAGKAQKAVDSIVDTGL